MMLLKNKSEACDQANVLFNKIQNEKGCLIKQICSDDGREFENTAFEDDWEDVGIRQEFSFPITPQHNGVDERKNMVSRHGSSYAAWENSCYSLMG